jgi:hypothetical protein
VGYGRHDQFPPKTSQFFRKAFTMRIGSSLALIAIGAILAFAVTDKFNSVDLTMVGYILLAVGALGVVLTLATQSSRDQGGPPRQ